MDWLWLIKQPWFDVSPNIWSMTFYLICGIVGGRILLSKGAQYKKWPVLIAFTDGLFLIFTIVLIQDTFWLLFNSMKWLGAYGTQMTFTNYWIRFPQNLVGLCFVFLCSYGVWKARLVAFTRSTLFWLGILILMMGINFAIAPNPSWTDYTYGVRMGVSDIQIAFGFFISHVVLKILMFLAFLGLFKTSRNSVLEESSKEVK